ncbi:hypothetical protein A9G06_15140 [Aeromonas sp. DNP9]|nr:hypothetical protein A9G06_15140 [Aeromonas sp. DNP9]
MISLFVFSSILLFFGKSKGFADNTDKFFIKILATVSYFLLMNLYIDNRCALFTWQKLNMFNSFNETFCLVKYLILK